MNSRLFLNKKRNLIKYIKIIFLNLDLFFILILNNSPLGETINLCFIPLNVAILEYRIGTIEPNIE